MVELRERERERFTGAAWRGVAWRGSGGGGWNSKRMLGLETT